MRGCLIFLSLCLLLCGSPVLAQQTTPATQVEGGEPSAPATAVPSGEGTPDEHQARQISGKIVDPTGVAVVGAKLKLTGLDQASGQEVVTDDGGQFEFASVPPGLFHLTITAAG